MPDSEKITINISAVDLGKIDLLVQEGLYSNRTDLIRTALRAQLDKHTTEIQQSVARNAYVVGALSYDRSDLEKYKQQGKKIRITILGLLHLQDNIPVTLAVETIESIKLLGIFIARDEIKSALADHMK